jgi:hypothetical protein
MTKFSLKTGVAQLEDSIIVLSGPALAISGIIAGVDLVTGGNILRSYPQFTLAWAITLLISLDFNILALGVRAHRVYVSKSKSGKRKCAEIALAFLIAAAISYVSIQMQSIIARVNAENISLDMAAMQLGINTLALIWERSSLVLVLIFMSGWLREIDTEEDTAEHRAVAAGTAPQIDVASLVNELDARLQQRLEQRIEAVYERVAVKIEQVVGTTGELPAVKLLNAPVENDEHVPTLENGLQAFQENAGTGKIESKERLIAAILARTPDASLEQVAQEAACSVRTAAKWLERLRQAP